MLTPATAATLLVVKPLHPAFAKTRAAALTMTSTVSCERTCCGDLRIVFFAGRMRVAKSNPPKYNCEYKLTFGGRQSKQHSCVTSEASLDTIISKNRFHTSTKFGSMSPRAP